MMHDMMMCNRMAVHPAHYRRLIVARGWHPAVSIKKAKREDNAVDMWDLLKWRKTLRYTQAEAGEKLGVNRGTIQNWERGITRIPKSTELAIQELTRRWKQRSEFGPVNLVYADDPVWRQPDDPYHTALLQSALYPSNEAAIEQALRLSDDPNFHNPIIIEKDGGIVWTTPELLRECERRRQEAGAKGEARGTGPPKAADTRVLNPRAADQDDPSNHDVD